MCRLKSHAAMEAAGTHLQWHEVNGAHAFLRDEGPRYDPVLAQQCYTLALEMYKRCLAEGVVMIEKPAAGVGEIRH
jgi:carboxymethylenebutenolidase